MTLSLHNLCGPARVCLIIVACTLAQAQSNSTGCKDVHVYASVLNHKKQVVAGLVQRDFSAELNGKAVAITDVEHNSPRRVVILIDHSGSMAELWHVVSAAVEDVLLLLPKNISVSVISFDQEIRDVFPLSTDRPAELTAVRQFFVTQVPKPKRTRLFDAVDVALTRIAPPTSGDVIYVVTDGADNLSFDVSKMKKRLVVARTRLFAGIVTSSKPGTSEETSGPIDVKELAEQSGGTVFRWTEPKYEYSLTKAKIDRLAAATLWLVQNMIDSYDLTLSSNQQLPPRVKVKFRVHMPELKDEKENRFEVVTQPVVATGCQ